MPKENFGKRLRAAMDCSGVKVTQLAKYLGVSRGAIYQVLDGSSSSMSADNACLSAELCGVDPIWLATGKGTMAPTERPAVSEVPVVPLDGLVPANLAELRNNSADFVLSFSSDDRAFAFTIGDNSMSPRYFRGTLVLVEPGLSPQVEDDVIVIHNNGAAKAHRLLGQVNGLTVGSWVSTDQPETLLPGEYRAVYVIVGRIHHSRKIINGNA